jgi:hypothetical protein
MPGCGDEMKGLNKDLVAGLFMIGLGALFIGLGTDYAFGTPAEMGPGFMPMMLAGGLIVLGAVNCAASLAARSGAMEPWHWRPLLLVMLSILIFSATIETAGLIVAASLTVLLGRLADAEGSPWDAILTAGSVIALFTATSLFDSPTASLSAGDPIPVAALAVTSGLILALFWRWALQQTSRRIAETFVLAAGLAFGSVLVFTNGLGLAMKTWPWG